MYELEESIKRWFAERFGNEFRGLMQQLQGALVKDRYFTDGGGAFISFEIEQTVSQMYPIKIDGKALVLDGPEIRSSELETGALATLFISDKGLVDFIEIWSYDNDYPVAGHPNGFTLLEPKINYIDLRQADFRDDT